MKYTVLAAQHEDVNSGWCWIKDENIKSRTLVKIKNINNDESIIIEALAIDDNFKRKYKKTTKSDENIQSIDNDQVLLLNGWYRNKLGIGNTQTEYNLDVSVIKKATILNIFTNCLKVKACLQHPQVAIRIATYLSILGTTLGILGILIPILENRNKLINFEYYNFLSEHTSNLLIFITGFTLGLMFAKPWFKHYILGKHI